MQTALPAVRGMSGEYSGGVLLYHSPDTGGSALQESLCSCRPAGSGPEAAGTDHRRGGGEEMIPPATPGGVCEGGRNRTDNPTYRRALNDVFRGLPHRVSLYDVDLVLEVDSQFRAIIEWKEYQKPYNAFYIPFFEYAGLKKIAKLAHAPLYGIIHQCEDYYVIPVDRFEDPRRRDRQMMDGKQQAVFYPSEALKLNSEEFRVHMRGIATGAI